VLHKLVDVFLFYFPKKPPLFYYRDCFFIILFVLCYFLIKTNFYHFPSHSYSYHTPSFHSKRIEQCSFTSIIINSISCRRRHRLSEGRENAFLFHITTMSSMLRIFLSNYSNTKGAFENFHFHCNNPFCCKNTQYLKCTVAACARHERNIMVLASTKHH
jgi:hypothetical protein